VKQAYVLRASTISGVHGFNFRNFLIDFANVFAAWSVLCKAVISEKNIQA
jgi:hypothetical protein